MTLGISRPFCGTFVMSRDEYDTQNGALVTDRKSAMSYDVMQS